MTRYDRYLWYVLRHKWFVLVECWKRGLYWRGLTHDLSKFLPDEFIPYARHFYGLAWSGVEEAFDAAWLRHQHRNDHHHQHWVLLQDDGNHAALEMPQTAMLEMLCDWIGAGKAMGKPDTPAWYRQARSKMQLHARTAHTVDALVRAVERENQNGEN